MSEVSAADVEKFILENYRHVSAARAWGELGFFVNPNAVLPRGAYFATLKFNDGENDRASKLFRAHVFRFNFGMAKNDFVTRFGVLPKRPAKGGVISGNWDFAELNVLTPHPVYGWMSWAAVLNPDKTVFQDIAKLLDGAHQKALLTAQKRIAKINRRD